MEIISGIFLTLGGIFMILIGFKIINVFHGVDDVEKANEWHRKYGLLVKICGIIALIAGLVNIIL